MNSLSGFIDNTLRLTELQATDFLPNSIEAQALKKSSREDRETISSIDPQILLLERQLDELRTRRATLIESSAAKDALLSPWRRLPPEILGAVFKCSVTAAFAESIGNGVTSRHAPLLLIRVCKRWRRVALGTPSLWTSLWLGRSEPKDRSAVTSKWMYHSGSLPINLYVRNCFLDAETGRYISANMHRVRLFHFRGDHLVLPYVFSLERTTRAQSLHELLVDLRVSRTELGVVSAPNLQFLHSINGGGPFIRKLVSDDQSRSFLHLQHLYITSHGDQEDIAIFLDNIYAPSLDTLLLSSHVDALAPSLRRLLIKSTPPLKHLTLERVQIPTDEDSLGALRHLEELILRHMDAQSFLEELVPVDTAHPGTWVLPRLTTLRLKGMVDDERTRVLVARVVRSRAHPGAHWQAVNLLDAFGRFISFRIRDRDLNHETREIFVRLRREVEDVPADFLD